MANTRSRPGYQRLPGRERRYLEIATGKEISRRQYIKKTEGVRSLEAKAKERKAMRAAVGERQPMKRYNAITEQYQATHPGKKVRGESKEAKEFKKQYQIFTKHTKTKQERLDHLDAAYKLGIISEEEHGRYTSDEE